MSIAPNTHDGTAAYRRGVVLVLSAGLKTLSNIILDYRAANAPRWRISRRDRSRGLRTVRGEGAVPEATHLDVA